jgi:hypothetical protein
MSGAWSEYQLRTLERIGYDIGREPDEVDEPKETERRSRRAWITICAVIGLIAVLIAGELARSGVQAQINARLRADGAGANTGLIAIEANQLSLLRAVTYTSGFPVALARADANELNALVTPLQANSGVPMLDIINNRGQVIFAVRSHGAPAPVASRKGVPAVAQSLKEAHNAQGGRFSEIAVLQNSPTLITIGPILYNDSPVGLVLTMTPLADVLGELAGETGVTLTAYNKSGQPIATTTPSNLPAISDADATTLMATGNVQFREIGSHRESLGRLIVDHTANAVLGVSMSDDSLVTELIVDLVGVLGLALVIVLMSWPWFRRNTAEAEAEEE